MFRAPSSRATSASAAEGQRTSRACRRRCRATKRKCPASSASVPQSWTTNGFRVAIAGSADGSQCALHDPRRGLPCGRLERTRRGTAEAQARATDAAAGFRRCRGRRRGRSGGTRPATRRRPRRPPAAGDRRRPVRNTPGKPPSKRGYEVVENEDPPPAGAGGALRPKTTGTATASVANT